MRTVPLILAAALVPAIGGCAQTAAERSAAADRAVTTQQNLDKALAGLVPGPASSCLPTSGVAQYSTVGYGRTILYRYSRGLVYRSDTQGGCETIAHGDILVTRQFGSQLCAGDIARTINPTSLFPTGSCSFGPFVPYRKPK